MPLSERRRRQWLELLDDETVQKLREELHEAFLAGAFDSNDCLTSVRYLRQTLPKDCSYCRKGSHASEVS